MTYFSSKDNGDQDEESHGGENAGILESNWLSCRSSNSNKIMTPGG